MTSERNGRGPTGPGRSSLGRLRRLPARLVDSARRSFWFPVAAAMAAGVVLGFLVPYLDRGAEGDFGVFAASDAESARGVLEAIGTATISVAGITFSVTVVALQLASQQLGPRVLETFKTNWLNRLTLAVFLGLFVYSLTAAGRLGSASEEPNLVLSVGISLAIVALGLFAVFIHGVVVALQASTLVRTVGAEAQSAVRNPYPDGLASAADGTDSLGEEEGTKATVRSTRAGFLRHLDGDAVIQAARRHKGVVRQKAPLGEFVVTGSVLAEVSAREDPEDLVEAVRGAFEIGQERLAGQDYAFPVRQLTDVALRALSPSLNDPTTAENAIGSIAEALIRFAEGPPVTRTRVDADGTPRFQACAPDLDDLVRLAFEQIRERAGEDPSVVDRITHLLGHLRQAAERGGHPAAEIDRQTELLGETRG